MQKALKLFLAFVLAAALLYIGGKFFLGKEERDLLLGTSVTIHLLAFLFCLPRYFLNGLELSLLYKEIYHKKLDTYDVLTLPIVINLWGFLLPFQGSLFYSFYYVRNKYGLSVISITSVFLFASSVTLSIGGIIGLIYALCSDTNPWLIPAFLLITLNPLLLILSKHVLGFIHTKFNLPFAGRLVDFLQGLIKAFGAKKLLGLLVLINLTNTAYTAAWSYWIALQLGLNLTFIQLLILSFLIKVTTLIKLTPGNLGVKELSFSGLIVLVGGVASEGFVISVYDSLILILTAFTLGSLFTILNFKYLNIQSISKIFSSGKEQPSQE